MAGLWSRTCGGGESARCTLADEEFVAFPRMGPQQSRARMTDRRTLGQNGARNGGVSPTGLTSKNIVERFSALRTIIGAKAYNAILNQHGYRDVVGIPTLEKSQEVYRALLEVFQSRYRESRRQLGEAEYAKILREMRLSPKAKLSPTKPKVFNHMAETLYTKR
jgi:hypothetical protein